MTNDEARSLKVFSVEHASSMGPAEMEEGGGATGFLNKLWSLL